MRDYLPRLRSMLCTFALACSLAAPAVAAAQDVLDEPKELQYIGYVASHDGPQVILRTNEPTGASVERVNRHLLVVHLNNCSLKRKLYGLPLDTRYFDGPIDRVVAVPIEGPAIGLRVEVHLRQAARWRMRRHGSAVALRVTPDRTSVR